MILATPKKHNLENIKFTPRLPNEPPPAPVAKDDMARVAKGFGISDDNFKPAWEKEWVRKIIAESDL